MEHIIVDPVKSSIHVFGTLASWIYRKTYQNIHTLYIWLYFSLEVKTSGILVTVK